jgi:pyridoxamine 5'-phosphate oxidase
MTLAVPLPADDPLAVFEAWYAAARAEVADLPEACALATATPDGRPSARMVLLKQVLDGRLCFFTSYQSRKAGELDANPHAALLFHWKELARQVRVEGVVERLPPEVSDAYFATRPRLSQLAAMASPQSRPIVSYEALEARVGELAREHVGRALQRPADWGGYALLPSAWEFWIGREARLHERHRYARDAGGNWRFELLGP